MHKVSRFCIIHVGIEQPTEFSLLKGFLVLMATEAFVSWGHPLECTNPRNFSSHGFYFMYDTRGFSSESRYSGVTKFFV